MAPSGYREGRPGPRGEGRPRRESPPPMDRRGMGPRRDSRDMSEQRPRFDAPRGGDRRMGREEENGGRRFERERPPMMGPPGGREPIRGSGNGDLGPRRDRSPRPRDASPRPRDASPRPRDVSPRPMARRGLRGSMRGLDDGIGRRRRALSPPPRERWRMSEPIVRRGENRGGFTGPIGYAIDLEVHMMGTKLEEIVQTYIGAKIGDVQTMRQPNESNNCVAYYGAYFRSRSEEDMQKILHNNELRLGRFRLRFGDTRKPVHARAVFKGPDSRAPTDEVLRKDMLRGIPYTNYRPFKWMQSSTKGGSMKTAEMHFENFTDFIAAARSCTNFPDMKLYNHFKSTGSKYPAAPVRPSPPSGGLLGERMDNRGLQPGSQIGKIGPPSRGLLGDVRREDMGVELRPTYRDDHSRDLLLSTRSRSPDRRMFSSKLPGRAMEDRNSFPESRAPRGIGHRDEDGEESAGLPEHDLRHSLPRKHDTPGAGQKRGLHDGRDSDRERVLEKPRQGMHPVPFGDRPREGKLPPIEQERPMKKLRYAKQEEQFLPDRYERGRDGLESRHAKSEPRPVSAHHDRSELGRIDSRSPFAKQETRLLPGGIRSGLGERLRNSPPLGRSMERMGRRPVKNEPAYPAPTRDSRPVAREKDFWVVAVKNLPREVALDELANLLRGEDVRRFDLNRDGSEIEIIGWDENALGRTLRIDGLTLKGFKIRATLAKELRPQSGIKKEGLAEPGTSMRSDEADRSLVRQRSSDRTLRRPFDSDGRRKHPPDVGDIRRSPPRERRDVWGPEYGRRKDSEENRRIMGRPWKIVVKNLPELVKEGEYMRLLCEYTKARTLKDDIDVRVLRRGTAEITGTVIDAFDLIMRLDGMKVGPLQLKCETQVRPGSPSPTSFLAERERNPKNKEFRARSDPDRHQPLRDQGRERGDAPRRGGILDDDKIRPTGTLPPKSPFAPRLSTSWFIPRSPRTGQNVEIPSGANLSRIRPFSNTSTGPVRRSPGPELEQLATRLKHLQNKIIDQRRDDEDSFDQFCASLKSLRNPQKLVHTPKPDPGLVGRLTWSGTVQMGEREAKRVRLILIPKPLVPEDKVSDDKEDGRSAKSHEQMKEDEAKLMQRLPVIMFLKYRCRFEDVAGTLDPDLCQVYWLKCEGTKHDRAYLKGMVRALRESGRVGVMKWDVLSNEKLVELIACPLTGWMAKRLKVPWEWRDVIGEGLVVFTRQRRKKNASRDSPGPLRYTGPGVRLDPVRRNDLR